MENAEVNRLIRVIAKVKKSEDDPPLLLSKSSLCLRHRVNYETTFCLNVFFIAAAGTTSCQFDPGRPFYHPCSRQHEELLLGEMEVQSDAASINAKKNSPWATRDPPHLPTSWDWSCGMCQK